MRRMLVNRIQLLFALGTAAVMYRAETAHADLNVTSWSVATGVQDLSSGGGQDTRRFSIVVNPFQNSHTATLGPGIATTSYDFSWSGDSGFFRIDASHVTPDLGNFFYASVSQGSIEFTTSTPLRAHFTGAYTYSLPVPAADVMMSFLVKDVSTGVKFINQSGLNDTYLHQPPVSGTFVWDQIAEIPGGRDCLILYGMQIITSQGSGQLATGSGNFQLTFEPVPEPATLAVLAIGLIAARISTRLRKNPHRR